jgi:hypothetical protein
LLSAHAIEAMIQAGRINACAVFPAYGSLSRVSTNTIEELVWSIYFIQ